MIKATDDEIREFFATTIFEGVFSHEIRSIHTDKFKGHINSIKINGVATNVIGAFINVPNYANDIPEGECTFKCRVKEDVRISPSQINFSLSPRTLRSKTVRVVHSDVREGELTNEDVFELWGVDNCEFIGYYHTDTKSDGYLIDDLRKTNFDRIPPYLTNKKAISLWLKYPQRDIELNNYYRFTWKLSHKDVTNPYEIYLDNQYAPQRITPKWFIDKLFEDRHSDKSKNFGSAANFLDTLSKQLSAKESTFVYELLQNANDYPVEGRMVDVEFHITDNYLLFLHSGDKFNVRNISGICGINEKEKVANRKTIGYKGIGFKTVFLNNHYVYLRTGDYSFRFDQGETPEKKRGGKIKRQDAPFQILPIWTEHEEVEPEVNSVFDRAHKKFQVQIALRPDDKRILHVEKNCYENLFREVFSDSNIILFIPNINSVRVFINGQEERSCFRNNEEWIVGDYENEIEEGLQLLINKTIEKGNSRIPEKYTDFDYTKVSFACKHEGAIIKPVEDATLYCYLPTKASWGLPFLMNTDMIPKGDRNDIETEVKLVDEDETNFNEELAAIAGSKLFMWVKELLTSRKYHLGSVFSLVPDFKKCKKEHKDYSNFIERFAEAFDKCLESEQIVPVPQGIALVNSVILDTTGLSTFGIMTDDEFCRFTGMEDYYLPLPMLRQDKHFNSFLKRYACDEQRFDEDNLSELIANDDFQEWLKVQENNNKFLKFLLDKGYLEDLMGEEIFLESEGGLYSASELYYDIDTYLVDLQAFTNHICYITPKTREFFKGNDEWNKVIEGEFNEFNCDDFVDDVLLSKSNIAETKNKLKDKITSIHFYKFLAENVQYSEKYSDLPFLDDQETVVDNFTDSFVFFSSEIGHSVCESQWMSGIDVHFLSKEYNEVSKKYFADKFCVRNYSNEILVKEIILSETYQEDIEDAISDMEDSQSFILFCFENKELFGMGGLKNYNLHVYNGDGESDWTLTESNVFFQSSRYDIYSSKTWIKSDWMFVLDEDYFAISNNREGLKDFFKKTFYVSDLSEESFYVQVVKENLPEIIRLTSGSEDSDGKKNIDFIHYLDENFKMVFEEKHDADKFKGFKPVSDETTDLTIDSTVYVYDEDLAEIIACNWFPDNLVNLCNKEVRNSRALVAMECSKYNFGDFFNDVISEEISSINDTIKNKEQSAAFHSFIIDHLGALTSDQQRKMIKAKVYLYGQDTPVATSSGHKILSAKAKELFEKGLVEISDLDIIDPVYQTEKNSEYWENRLENSKFNITHFFSWLQNNTSTFCETLQDEEKNVIFWKWLKENATDKSLNDLPVLPVLLKDGSIDNSNNAVYFSDEYMEGFAIESSVKRLDPSAPFISPQYISDEDSIESWKDFWIKVGVKYEIIDILIETIRKGLANVEDESLPKLIAENRDVLEKHYENGLVPELCELKVKAHDGQYYSVDKTIYIDCEKEEPFPYVELPNQIRFDSSEERRLIKDIMEHVDGDCVKTLSEWQQRKLDCYLMMQQQDNETVRSFHFDFINDLSIIRNTSKDSLKDLERIEDIMLLNKDGEFCTASELTMSSVYNPFFDFESCGIDTLEYVSDTYSEKCSEYVGRIFRELNVHCDFQEDDIKFLEERPCAIYFWSRYLLKKDAAIKCVKQFISDKKIDGVACIPTKDYMKCSRELYYGADVSRYIKSIEDWENKVPLDTLPDVKLPDDTTLFSKLPFKESLDFLDALYALISISGQERRTQLLNWMIDDYDESFDAKIKEYRDDEHALWYNNKNESKQIKDLYALDYWDKALDQYFGTNVRIINKAYFPTGDSFKKACDILGIKTITSEDLKMEPVNDSVYTARDTNHRLYALVISGMIDCENWKDLYKGYCDRLDSIILHRCESILITYTEDDEINQSLKKFYHKEGENDFYFVDSLDGKRVFKSFVEEYIKFLDIDTDEIAEDVIEDIMDSKENALAIIKEQNSLMLDEEFKNELDKLIPGIKRELFGNEVVEDNEEVVTSHRPSFTTQESSSFEEEVEESPDDEDVSTNDNATIFPTKLEAPDQDETDFIQFRREMIELNGRTEEVVCEYYRNGTWVRGHWRNGSWVNGYWRNGSTVGEHTRSTTPHVNGHSQSSTLEPEDYTQSNSSVSVSSSERTESTHHVSPEAKAPKTRPSTSNTSSTTPRSYSDMSGWDDSNRPYSPQKPKPFSPEDVRNFGSHGVTRTLEVLEPTASEVDEINHILGEDLSAAQVADQNYLAQLRLYNNLQKKGYTPEESKSDFIRNAHLKNEHTLGGGKYIHKCSAAGGIMYLSPSIWNKIADDRCVVCVYLGAKANEFMYFNSIDDILKWIGEDDIVIKLTGEEKADVVEELYSGVLDGVKGTAYTLIRINSNEKYNSLFAQLPTNNDINETEENEDEY